MTRVGLDTCVYWPLPFQLASIAPWTSGSRSFAPGSLVLFFRAPGKLSAKSFSGACVGFAGACRSYLHSFTSDYKKLCGVILQKTMYVRSTNRLQKLEVAVLTCGILQLIRKAAWTLTCGSLPGCFSTTCCGGLLPAPALQWRSLCAAFLLRARSYCAAGRL